MLRQVSIIETRDLDQRAALHSRVSFTHGGRVREDNPAGLYPCRARNEYDHVAAGGISCNALGNCNRFVARLRYEAVGLSSL